MGKTVNSVAVAVALIAVSAFGVRARAAAQSRRPIAIGIAAVPTLRVLDPEPSASASGRGVRASVVTELTVAYVWEGQAELGVRARLGLPVGGELGLLGYARLSPACTAFSTLEAGRTCFLVGGEAGYVAWEELMSDGGAIYAGPELGLDTGLRTEWLRLVSVSALARGTVAHVGYANDSRGWVFGADLVLDAEVRF